ncbi:MAG TPA: hypothetical protein PKE00_06725 [Planctomycetota bacterium]|nr:hypothetical protein [Planctomycetota bacterium]
MTWNLRFWRRRDDDPEEAARFEAALSAAMIAHGIHEAFRETLRRLVHEDSSSWRRCCGSGCEPCVLQFERAVDAVRAALESDRAP